MQSHATKAARSSAHSRAESEQGRVFALERQSSELFLAVAQAARSGFPRDLVSAAKQTLEAARAKGETLSPRTAELLRLLNTSLRGARQSAPSW